MLGRLVLLPQAGWEKSILGGERLESTLDLSTDKDLNYNYIHHLLFGLKGEKKYIEIYLQLPKDTSALVLVSVDQSERE